MIERCKDSLGTTIASIVPMRTEFEEDQRLASMIYLSLRRGDRQPIISLYKAHQGSFLKFAKRRLFDPNKADEVLQAFWLGLLNGKALRKYVQGSPNEPKVSLRNYLLNVLYSDIKDQNRKDKREKALFVKESDLPRSSDGEDQTDVSIWDPADPSAQQDDLRREELIRRLVHQALLDLVEQYPRDADLMRMHLDGLSHRDKALVILQREGGEITHERIKRKENAIKKQFTRPETGTLARFKIIFEGLMKDKKMTIHDILE